MNKIFIVPILIGLMFASCGGGGKKGNLADGASGDIVAYQNSDVNAVEQARPAIMVIPSDMTLKRFGCLKSNKMDGIDHITRDYQTYILKDDRCRRLTSHIQNKFNEEQYPLNDFEQTLKQISTKRATDMADDIGQDAKTLLLLTARPDIILELDYQTTADNNASLTSHNYGKSNRTKNLSYTLSAIDAYSNKVVATITASNLKGASTTEEIQNDIDKNTKRFMKDIQNYYSDILMRGRDVTVRINLDGDCNINLQDESVEGDTYSDWIIDYIKSHTIKGAYKMQINTDKELSFANVRIPLLNSDGTQYGVYDWTRDLQKNLRKNLGLQSVNRSQGLGEVVLTIKKM